MVIKSDLQVSSCWIVTEDLVGLQNQAIGLAQALRLPYILKEIKRPKGLLHLFSPVERGLIAPWPDMLISCGRQSGPVSVAIRRASKNKTFTVHIQDLFIDPKQFDVVIVPTHDKMRGKNVFVTQGAIHHVSTERLNGASMHFRPLLSSLPRPLICVLVGGKNKHQGFSDVLAHDFAKKLLASVAITGGGLAISFS